MASFINTYMASFFAAAWWQMFGSSTPTLQKLAIQLVSQCASSSGCERNWSTFAFIHTKIRNRLSFKKLHKLVYVNYNLRIQNNLDGGSRRDDDPFNKLMELTLCDENNPIQEGMQVARSTQAPELDEEDTESDCPLPSHLVTDTIASVDLQRETGSQNLSQWAQKTIGDSHMGKRKRSTMRPRTRSKRTKVVVTSDATTEDENDSPTYQESGDSSSNSDAGDDDGAHGGNTGGTGEGGGNIGGTSLQPLSPFTADNQEYATQDTDHGVPSSQRVVTGPDVGVQHAYGPYSQSEDSSGSSTFPGTYEYNMPDMRTQQPIRWVHEWVDPEFYEQLHSQWRTTYHWTGQTWMEYKAGLLQAQGIMVVSTEEYYAMHRG